MQAACLHHSAAAHTPRVLGAWMPQRRGTPRRRFLLPLEWVRRCLERRAPAFLDSCLPERRATGAYRLGCLRLLPWFTACPNACCCAGCRAPFCCRAYGASYLLPFGCLPPPLPRLRLHWVPPGLSTSTRVLPVGSAWEGWLPPRLRLPAWVPFCLWVPALGFACPSAKILLTCISSCLP